MIWLSFSRWTVKLLLENFESAWQNPQKRQKKKLLTVILISTKKNLSQPISKYCVGGPQSSPTYPPTIWMLYFMMFQKPWQKNHQYATSPIRYWIQLDPYFSSGITKRSVLDHLEAYFEAAQWFQFKLVAGEIIILKNETTGCQVYIFEFFDEIWISFRLVFIKLDLSGYVSLTL